MGGTVLVLVPSVLQSCTKPAENDPDTNMGTNPGTNPGTKPGSSGSTKIELDLGSAENVSLNSTGGSRTVQGVIVVNSGGGNFVALSSVCTHEGCTIEYNSVAENIQCPCHGSVFTSSGSVVTGPATISLKTYSTSKSGSILTILL